MKEWIVKVVPTTFDDSTAQPSDLEVLDPDHPLLEAYQADLTRFLQEEERQLTLKIIHQVATIPINSAQPTTTKS